MSNAIMGGMADHVGHDTLDDRHDNLRLCSTRQNGCNRRKNRNNKSGYIGVHYHRLCKKWQAALRVNGVKIYLGLFPTAEDAARVRDYAAIEHHGQFASLNFPRNGE
jgi:hypothetical protein